MLKKVSLGLIVALIIVSPALAEDLGPSTATNVGSDPSTLNALQPANAGSIPSANATAGGIGLPDASSALQPAGTRADLPSFDFNTEADGPLQDQSATPPNESNGLKTVFVGLISLLLLISAFFLFRISRLVDTRVPLVDTVSDNFDVAESSLPIPKNDLEVQLEGETAVAVETSPKPPKKKPTKKRSRAKKKS